MGAVAASCARCGRPWRRDLAGSLCADCKARGFTTAPANPHLVKVTAPTATQVREAEAHIEDVESITIAGTVVNKGDVVQVDRSARGKRDGYLATFVKARLIDEAVTFIDVYGGPRGRAGQRTVHPGRVHPVRAKAVS